MPEYAPITEIYLLSGVPLDNTYRDTLTFASLTAQHDYFYAKQKFDYNDATYQRPNAPIRVDKPIEELWDINYVMYRNPNFATYPDSGKWFYAFVTNLEYKNAECTFVHFEIDVMQTWYFDYTRKRCFVEREHVANDSVGANLVPESLELGDYRYGGIYTVQSLNDFMIVLCRTSWNGTADKANASGRIVSGIYSAVSMKCYTTSQVAELDAEINGLMDIGRGEAILAIFMMPTAIVPAYAQDGHGALLLDGATPNSVNISHVKYQAALDGYTPRNKKLLTAPFNFMTVTNFQGDVAIYPYEYFENSTCTFKISGSLTADPVVFMMPTDYKDVSENFHEAIRLSGYPYCAWSHDVYRNWLAQNTASLVTQSALGFNAAAVGLASGNPLAAGGGIVAMTQVMTQLVDRAVVPPQAKGSLSKGSNFGLGYQTFAFMPTSIQAQFAQRIDLYFDVAGYAVNTVKVPNITGRPSWNYVKTVGCCLTGHVPFDHMAKIKECYNRGITFWHGDWVGDYSRDNTI